MPNIFQKLSAQIRALKEENEELKRNSNGGKSYIKQLFKMTIKNIKLKKQIERMNADLNALSNLIDAPPSYEEVISNPLKIQALIRGFLTRKTIQTKCCVCYEKCFNKNTCCNSFLCGDCRPRCNGKCPMCRTNWTPNIHVQGGMFEESDSEDEEEVERDQITELILNPTHEMGHLVLYNRRIDEEEESPFRFWIQLSVYNNNNFTNGPLRNQYRNIFYDDVPNTHQLEFTLNWMNQTLEFLDKFRLIDLNRMRNGEIHPYSHQFCGFRFGENVSIELVENSQGAYNALKNIVNMPSHWTNETYSPQVYRINAEGEAYQYSHDNTGRMGSARGFPRDIGDEYLGQTGSAKARRGVHRIMNEYCEIKHIAGMEFKGAIVKYRNKYKCIIQYNRNV